MNELKDQIVEKCKLYSSKYGSIDDLESIMQLIETYTTNKCEEYKKEMFDTAYSTFKIMGKSIDEICVILSALELERITDIKVTMDNLDKLSKIVTEDLRESYQKAITESFTQLSTEIKTNKEKEQ